MAGKKKRKRDRRDGTGKEEGKRFKRLSVMLSLKLAIVVLVTFALAEVSLRAYQKLNPTYLLAPKDEVNRFRGVPHADVYGYRLNSKGFKDIEYDTGKKPGTYRILGIGDSFVYGVVPYPDNFLTLLEERLLADGFPVEVINMGISGVGPYEYRMLLKDEGLGLSPDLVMVFFYVGNDIMMFADRDMIPEKVDEHRPRSYVFALAKRIYRIVVGSNVLNLVSSGYDDKRPSFSDEKYMRLTRANAFKFVKSPNGILKVWEVPQWKHNYGIHMGNMMQLKKLCDGGGVRLLVVLVPEEIQVDEDLQDKVLPYYPSASGFDFAELNRIFTDVFSGRQIEVVDLLPAFRDAYQGSGESLYKPNDGHWNVAGNRLASDVLYRYLVSGDFLAPVQAGHLETGRGGGP